MGTKPEREVRQFVDDAVETRKSDALDAVVQDGAAILEAQQKRRERFERELDAVWGRALDGLDLIILRCRAVGLQIHEASGHPRHPPTVQNVLFRLWGRGCQVSMEITFLLRGGFADGAIARWRTLHELMVVAVFIRQRGEPMAKRYVEHAAVEKWSDATEYSRHCGLLGYEPVPQADLDRMQADVEALKRKYGKSFLRLRGWADLSELSEIEVMLDLEKWRPHVRLAHHNIHAGPHGVFQRLGMPENQQGAVLLGPTLFAIEEAAHRCAITLSILTNTLAVPLAMDAYEGADVDANDTIGVMGELKAIKGLVEELGEMLFETAQRLQKSAVSSSQVPSGG